MNEELYAQALHAFEHRQVRDKKRPPLPNTYRTDYFAKKNLTDKDNRDRRRAVIKLFERYRTVSAHTLVAEVNLTVPQGASLLTHMSLEGLLKRERDPRDRWHYTLSQKGQEYE